jgi:streptogramin lyase
MMIEITSGSPDAKENGRGYMVGSSAWAKGAHNSWAADPCFLRAELSASQKRPSGRCTCSDHRLDSGDLFRYDSRSNSWRRWHLPGDRPQPYAVYVDDTDVVWISDWGANAILRFDPKTESFESFPLPDSYASVRQLAGRKGEVWAESAADKLFMIKSE